MAALSILPKAFTKKLGHFILRAVLNDVSLQSCAFQAISDLRHDARRKLVTEDGEFLTFCLNKIGSSHAQIFQDLWVLHELKGKSGGYFVEFGATDGISFSNTYLLEKDHGWTGILAEPNPVWHEKLLQNRTCNISKKCVYSSSGKSFPFLAMKSASKSGIGGFMRPEMQRRARDTSKVIEVDTISLGGLLEEYGAPAHIDFISVDTEGSELEILEAFDFGKWEVQLFCIEHNNTGAEQKIENLLTAKGYERRHRELSLFDAWFAKRR